MPKHPPIYFDIFFPEIKLDENEIKVCSFEQISNLLIDFNKKRNYSYEGKEQTLVLFNISDQTKYEEFINLLDDVISLVLDFYPIIFHSGCWELYKEAMIHV